MLSLLQGAYISAYEACSVLVLVHAEMSLSCFGGQLMRTIYVQQTCQISVSQEIKLIDHIDFQFLFSPRSYFKGAFRRLVMQSHFRYLRVNLIVANICLRSIFGAAVQAFFPSFDREFYGDACFVARTNNVCFAHP